MMNIETSNVTVSLEQLDVSKIKIDGRPPISKPKTFKTKTENIEHAPYPQMSCEKDADSAKAGESCKPLDNVENIENGRGDKSVDQPKLQKEESSETRHLKDLLLLHLDLIQQQQELYVLKDRQISQLKQDNYAVSTWASE